MKPKEDFRKRKVNGSEYLRSRCRRCCNSKMTERNKHNGHKYKARVRRNERKRADRLSGKNPCKWILEDCKRSDRKRKQKTTVTIPEIELMVSNGCLYCGSKDKMTLDRIDNTKGHTKDNVNPCCYRCNMIRRDMPYEAWLSLVPSIKDTQEKGLFGDWTCGPKGRTV